MRIASIQGILRFAQNDTWHQATIEFRQKLRTACLVLWTELMPIRFKTGGCALSIILSVVLTIALNLLLRASVQ